MLSLPFGIVSADRLRDNSAKSDCHISERDIPRYHKQAALSNLKQKERIGKTDLDVTLYAHLSGA